MKRIKKDLAEGAHPLFNNRKIMRRGKEAQDYLHRRKLIDDEDMDQLICFGEVVIDNQDEIGFEMAYPWLLKYRGFHHPAEGINFARNGQERPEDSRCLPPELITQFVNVPHNHIMDILLGIQRLNDIQRIDVSQNDNETVMGLDVVRDRYFLMSCIPHAAIYWNQICQYINNPILERSVNYLLLIDENKRMLVIKNLPGYWTTVKAHRRIKNDRSLETPQECLSREFNRLIQVENLITDEIYDHFDMDQYLLPGRYQYVEVAPSSYQGANVCIDLFIYQFRANSLAFRLRNADAFQTIDLNSIYDIPENTIGTERDIYYALRYLLKD